MMEIFAGFLSHTDYHIGRLMQALEKLGDLDNTLVMLVSDNGASGEGGYFGSFNENLIFNGVPDTFEQNFKRIDDLGSREFLRALSHRLDHGGQHTVQTLEAQRLQRRHRRPDASCRGPRAFRRAARFATSTRTPSMCPPPFWIFSTSSRPPCSTACRKKPSPGPASNPPSKRPQAEEVRTLQYYELYGSRALYLDGWKAVTFHPMPGVPSDGPGDPNLAVHAGRGNCTTSPTTSAKCHDLAAQEPERLQTMIGLWFAEAGKYDVFPIHAYQRKAQRPKPAGRSTGRTSTGPTPRTSTTKPRSTCACVRSASSRCATIPAGRRRRRAHRAGRRALRAGRSSSKMAS